MCTERLSLICPAKINIFLEVLDKRPDNYHNIDTVMQKISLSDEITLEVSQNDEDTERNTVSVTSDNSEIPVGEGNICWKAANLFLDTFGIVGVSVDIFIKKRIPAAAGLGGGSSDAAGVLRALGILFDKEDDGELISIASRIGADVPFFVHTAKTARCLGIGEIIEPLLEYEENCLLVAIKGKGVLARDAYTALDLLAYSKQGVQDMINAIEKGKNERIPSLLYNSFEFAILPTHDEARLAKELMLKLGADSAIMSGSGPSVFGIFKTTEDAQRASDALSGLGYAVYLTKTL